MIQNYASPFSKGTHHILTTTFSFASGDMIPSPQDLSFQIVALGMYFRHLEVTKNIILWARILFKYFYISICIFNEKHLLSYLFLDNSTHKINVDQNYIIQHDKQQLAGAITESSPSYHTPNQVVRQVQ